MTQKKMSQHPRTADDQQQGFDKDQPRENAGAPLHQRTKANDKGLKPSQKPEPKSDAIPPLDEPDVEGVGNEGGDRD